MQRGVRSSLVGDLRSHISLGQKNQNIKQKQYYNKFNKYFKKFPHQKNIYIRITETLNRALYHS